MKKVKQKGIGPQCKAVHGTHHGRRCVSNEGHAGQHYVPIKHHPQGGLWWVDAPKRCEAKR